MSDGPKKNPKRPSKPARPSGSKPGRPPRGASSNAPDSRRRSKPSAGGKRRPPEDGKRHSGDQSSPWKKAEANRSVGNKSRGRQERTGASDSRSRGDRKELSSSSSYRRGKPSVKPQRTRKRKASTLLAGFDIPEWLLLQKGPGLTSDAVKEIISRLALPDDLETTGKLLDHLLLVREMNEEVNLVSRANVDTVLLQSLWECLVPMTNTSWKTGDHILDLGTGGGFPGIPLAIMMPDVHMTLVDSRRAKTLALKNMADELKLKNVEVIHDRAETYSAHVGRTHDTITVRAVGMLKEVAPWASSLLRDGGSMLAWKGPEGTRELLEIPRDDWKLENNLAVLPHRFVMVLRYRG